MENKWRWVSFSLIYLALYYCCLFFIRHPIVHILVAICGTSVVLVWIWLAYRRLRPKQRLFWLLLLISLSTYWIRESILLYETAVKQTEWFLWQTNGLDEISMILYFIALLYLATAKETRVHLFQQLLDVLIIVSVGALVGSIGLNRLFSLSYLSVSDLFIFSSIFLLELATAYVLGILFFSSSSAAKPVLAWHIAGAILLIAADGTDRARTLLFDYSSPSHSLDFLIFAGLLMMGLSAVFADREIFLCLKNQKSLLSFKVLFLYMAFIPSIFFFILHEEAREAREIAVIFMAIGVFVIMRQAVALYESTRLFRSMQLLNRGLEQKLVNQTTESERKTEELLYLARHDCLTRLLNRSAFIAALEQALQEAKQQHHLLAVIFIDLDRFKQVNHYFGHRAGDALMVKMTEWLKQSLRPTDVIGRQGGDEFALIVSPVYKLQHLRSIVESILSVSKQPLPVNDLEMRVSMSMGIAVFPYDGETGESLMKKADIALSRAKEQGKNQYQFFNGKMDQGIMQKTIIETAIYQAIEQREFTLFYQPQFDIATGQMIGMEALIRWHHPQTGLIPPHMFIPVAEETGQIIAIGEWVMEEACRQVKQWNEQTGRALRISVNISPKQFLQEKLVEQITAILKKTNLTADSVDLEITEGVAIFNEQHTIQKLKQLKALGVHISIDDFGTGYSSLSYLRKFPIHRLKIAKVFIDGIAQTEEDQAIVASVIGLAKNLKLRVIAEGVETFQQLQILRSLHCDEIQGYVLGKPLVKEEFEKVYLK
ncbi:Phytochrome-like protein cph2 [Anoxybacillus sp. P3H1B]|uniref:putative bifunctional diguanylate cyclase/phosphodiesterase n=1 Tax=Anoxybacillus sp. P3H1B TaxID=1769293 RepID=UPI000797025A|nr:GGDEF and EAL domain-containing protein [Anoxybacillus sp. P3H1B]KXG10979.1 Phytochrome-like protein cph2 [Anoxybacillus sp. P3H1B]